MRVYCWNTRQCSWFDFEVSHPSWLQGQALSCLFPFHTHHWCSWLSHLSFLLRVCWFSWGGFTFALVTRCFDSHTLWHRQAAELLRITAALYQHRMNTPQQKASRCQTPEFSWIYLELQPKSEHIMFETHYIYFKICIFNEFQFEMCSVVLLGYCSNCVC